MSQFRVLPYFIAMLANCADVNQNMYKLYISINVVKIKRKTNKKKINSRGVYIHLVIWEKTVMTHKLQSNDFLRKF